MEDKRKLVTVITSAVSAYLQTEQAAYLASPAPTAASRMQSYPGPKISQWKMMGRWKLTTTDRKIGVRL